MIEDPPEWRGKFAFELSLWNFEGTKLVGSLGEFGPYDTEEMAKAEMKTAVDLAVRSAQEAAGATPNGDFVDLKNGGHLRNFGEES